MPVAYVAEAHAVTSLVPTRRCSLECRLSPRLFTRNLNLWVAVGNNRHLAEVEQTGMTAQDAVTVNVAEGITNMESVLLAIPDTPVGNAVQGESRGPRNTRNIANIASAIPVLVSQTPVGERARGSREDLEGNLLARGGSRWPVLVAAELPSR